MEMHKMDSERQLKKNRKEGGKIFGSGSRTPIAITLLVKKSGQSGKAKIMYHDIGDYLSREDKLKIISDFHDVSKLPLEKISPNEHGDWISKRNDKFGTWIPIGDKENKNNSKTFFVPAYGRGLATSRDSWCYNSSKKTMVSNIKNSIDFYNSEVDRYLKAKEQNPEIKAIDFIDYDSTKFSWDRSQKENDLPKGKKYDFSDNSVREAMYRPFFKQHCYFNRQLNNCVYQLPQFQPKADKVNIGICTKGVGDRDFSCLITNCIPDLQVVFNGQCFPLYWYETIEQQQGSLFEDEEQIVKHEAISDFILDRAQSKYGNKVQREDIFYYVYGILHSKSYRETFSADLKKMLPRIPLVSDYEKFWAFSKAGRDLANLHLNYEKVAPCPDVIVEGDDKNDFIVKKMSFPKKGEKQTIIYNDKITITNIPEKAYEYVVNGKSAIEWIMERYAVTVDQKSGITNNPNDWAPEHDKPRYILDLLLSVINVSVQTVDIVNSLPEVDWDKE